MIQISAYGADMLFPSGETDEGDWREGKNGSQSTKLKSIH